MDKEILLLTSKEAEEKVKKTFLRFNSSNQSKR